MKSVIIGAVASLALCGVANAEGFDGFYVGAALANSSNNFSPNTSGAATFKLTSYRNALADTNGEGFAAQAGYNTHYKGLFVGVEVNYNGADAAETFENNPHRVTLVSELDNITDLRVRVGGEIDDTLFYLFGGAAQADASITATSTATVNPVVAARTDTVSASHSGVVFGGGVSRKITDRFAVFGEIAHYDLGDQNYDFPVGSKFGTNSVNLTSTAVKAGINIHFK